MRRRILLADDSVTIQKVIELTFMDEDYEVRAVSNGDEAVALLPEAGADFVIADVHMPGANGYEVCRRSKQLRPQVPVLLLVGTFEPFDENEARTAGADSFLKKPFDSQELLQRVQELLASRAGAAAAAAAAPPPVFPAMDLPPMPAINAAPELPAEPSWGSFSLEPEAPPFPSMPEPFQAPAAPEPFDREPSFTLEPDPTYQVEAEPVFALEEDTPSYAIREDVFGAPDELSLEPQDRYLPDEPAAWPAPAASAEPEPWPEAQPWTAASEPQPWSTPAEPESAVPAEPQPWAEPEPWSPEPEPWSPQPEPAVFTPVSAPPPAAPEPPAATNGGGRLSDEDVDRIARRVAELLGDKAVRDVAWEVIPDMAEVIIRDRLRELESQVE